MCGFSVFKSQYSGPDPAVALWPDAIVWIEGGVMITGGVAVGEDEGDALPPQPTGFSDTDTTKIHRCWWIPPAYQLHGSGFTDLPLAIQLTAANRNDLQQALSLVD